MWHTLVGLRLVSAVCGGFRQPLVSRSAWEARCRQGMLLGQVHAGGQQQPGGMESCGDGQPWLSLRFLSAFCVNLPGEAPSPSVQDALSLLLD